MASLLKHFQALTLRQKLGLSLGYLLTILLTVAVTYGLSSLGDDPEPASEVEEVPLEVVEVGPDPWDEPIFETGVMEEPEPEEKKPVTPPPPKKKQKKASPPEPKPEVKKDPVPEPEPAEPDRTVMERALEADRFLNEKDPDSARETATRLLADYGTQAELTGALKTDGAGEIQARLLGLRTLQAAGREQLSRDVARVLRRSYAGTEEVAETIRSWKILRPRVVTAESFVTRSGHLTVSGTVENPDIVSVRRVEVAVIALDAAGNRLEVLATRARPKRIEPEGAGTFKVPFKGIDPSTIARTRAWVTEFEYETLDQE